MKSRYIYFVIFVVIYITVFSLISPLATSNITNFYSIFIGLVILAVLNIRLVYTLLSPLRFLDRAKDSLKMGDFTQKFKKTGQPEMDSLINIYNEMLDKLREERIKITENDHFLESLLNDQPNGIVILAENSIDRLNPAAQKFLSLSALDIPNALQTYEKGSMLEIIANLKDSETKLYTQNNLYFYQLEKKHFIDHGKKKYFVVIKELYSRLLEAEQIFQNNILKYKMDKIVEMKNHLSEIVDESPEKCKNELELMEKKYKASEVQQILNQITHPLSRKEFSLHNAVYVAYLQYQTNSKVKWDWELQDDDITFMGDVDKLQNVFSKIIDFALQNIGRNYGKITLTSQSKPQSIITITDDGAHLPDEQIQQLFAPEIIDEKNINLVFIREVLLKHHIKFEYFITEKGNNFRLYF